MTPAKVPPEWMTSPREDGFAEHVAAVEPDIVIEHTRFCEAFPANPEHTGTDKDYLQILISAAFPRDATDLVEWRSYLEEYPVNALTDEQVGMAQNPDVQVRAHFLRHAMTRLLQLVQAPEALIADLQTILDCHKPRAADLRAEAQAEWCQNPETNARAIARNQARNHGQLYKDMAAGLLVQPSTNYQPTPRGKAKRRATR